MADESLPELSSMLYYEMARRAVGDPAFRAALFEGVRVAADGIRALRTDAAPERLRRLGEAGLAEALTTQAVVEERESSCSFGPDCSFHVDAHFNLVIELDPQAAAVAPPARAEEMPA